jgi:hypothetical protein
VTVTFLPRSQFHVGLRSYHLGARHQSEEDAIRTDDLEVDHFRRTEGVSVRIETTAISDDDRTVHVSSVVSPTENEWPDSFRISLVNSAILDIEDASHGSTSLVPIGTTSIPEGELDPSLVQLVGGQLIEGDPETHRLSFLTNSDVLQFDQAILLFCGRSSMFAAFEESEDPFPSLVGRLMGVVDGIATFELNRPAQGWGDWGVNRLPYSLHLGEGNPADDGFLVSGHVTVHSLGNPLPLLFSFEEWVRRMEEQAELPRGSLEGDAEGDGVDSVLEYTLGSDLTDNKDTDRIKPKVVLKEGKCHLQLEFPVRINSIALKAEIQHSVDNVVWKSADEDFEMVAREETKPGVIQLRVCSKKPLTDEEPVGFFRIAVAR